jgi:hypothetical protein
MGLKRLLSVRFSRMLRLLLLKEAALSCAASAVTTMPCSRAAVAPHSMPWLLGALQEAGEECLQ